ncbi:flavin monoamine oxidase family protein [Streptomyces griseoloalbus]|uniref:Monoamine oxidase n=1 Tax=Streptomyces griseoloalbus TaxID=67303 RepID=A0A7W8BNW9_9ACTN|nr:NAD(P)/FAD-dependent oxidoreductase [Streptomyces albaduncus]MBB5125816.1 monoamine oxidase [Streptomyces albaduncus]GGV64904.1 putative putrescine oxidase [Streptomyces griseoloalbus]GGW48064.1 putative putrescine oxidase [Streptomyces albaduncus]
MSSRPVFAPRHGAIASPGRRLFLKAAGATALAGAIGATPYSGSTAHAADGATSDVIVIGAGYAGGTAARELAAQGLKVTVLEARDRIGGRIWTDTFAGQRIELGGGWLSPDHELVAHEMQRYGLTNVGDVVPVQSVMPSSNGFQAMSPAEANAHLGTLFEQFHEGSQEYFARPHDPLYRADLLQQIDQLSFTDRIAQLSMSELDKEWLAGYFTAYTGNENSRRAMTSMAQWWALGGWSMEGWEKQTAYKPAGGMTELLQKMLATSGIALKLSSPVAAVTSASDGVQVKLVSGQVYKAGAVVVATPVNTWKTIQFSPALPSAHTAATTEGVGVSLSTKIWMQLSGSVEAVYAQGTENSALPLMIPQQELSGGGRLMVGFAGSSLNVADKAAVQAAVRTYIPGATLVSYRAQQWGADRYARGGWGLRRPTQLLRQLPALHQPHGRMVFAGADIASGWNGAFIEGAVETGMRAAQQVAALV